MKEKSLSVFVDGLTNYFNTVSSDKAKVSTPFLIQDINEYLFDFTGIIGISGNHKGSIFFTAPRIMMVKLISEVSAQTTKDEKLLDLVGEVSNPCRVMHAVNLVINLCCLRQSPFLARVSK